MQFYPTWKNVRLKRPVGTVFIRGTIIPTSCLHSSQTTHVSGNRHDNRPAMIAVISFFFQQVTSKSQDSSKKPLSFIGHVAVDNRGDDTASCRYASHSNTCLQSWQAVEPQGTVGTCRYCSSFLNPLPTPASTSQ